MRVHGTLGERIDDRFARRTLERRGRDLKAKHGPAQEIIFRQKHEPGRRGARGQHCGGAAVAHKLYHSRLEYAGFCYAAVVVGGEGLRALAEGLQEAREDLAARYGGAAGGPRDGGEPEQPGPGSSERLDRGCARARPLKRAIAC